MGVWIAVAGISLVGAVALCLHWLRPEKNQIPEAFAETPFDTLLDEDGQQLDGELVNLAELYAKDPPQGDDGYDFFGNPTVVSSGGEEAPAENVEAEPGIPQEDVAEVRVDHITQLHTGRGFLIECQKALTLAKMDGRIFALAYFDFDRFRFINNLKGVLTGDCILSRMAQEMRKIFPAEALCSRLSADHFVALFPLPDESMVEDCANQLLLVCEQVRDELGFKGGIHIRMGVALTLNRERDFDIGILIHRANIARHCLKSNKSQSWSIYDDAMTESYIFGESAMDDYSEKQYDEDFVLYFQPQASLTKNRIVSGEVLARWKCLDDVPRAEPLSTENGKLPTQGNKVFYQACRAIGRWRKSGKEVPPIMIPLGIIDLYKQDIDEFISRCLSDCQIDSSAVMVELQATIFRTDWSMAARQIKKITDLGIKVAVEGIDLGYTSLDFLNGVDIQVIKLQKGFVYRIRENAERRRAAVSMMQKAAALGIQVVFEGVDTMTQAETLTGFGAQIIQGHYVGKPNQPDDFMKALQEYARSHSNTGTLILDDSALFKGEYNIY